MANQAPAVIEAQKGRVPFSANHPAAIHVARLDERGLAVLDEDQRPIFDIVPAPIGSHELYNAPRMCGDWYAEFTAGLLCRAAVRPTQLEAIQAAAAKFGHAA